MLPILATNPLFEAYRGSDLVGKTIFLSLLVLSLITWTLFIKKLLIYKQHTQRDALFSSFFHKKRLNPLSLDVKDEHPFAALYQTCKYHTLELLGKNQAVVEQEAATLSRSDMDLVEAHLMSTISAQTKSMERNLFLLSTIVSLAPFLGLLGTVWGILLTFNELQTGAAANSNAVIMGGLAMALGTTVAGLIVAIPALIGYNYLRAATAQFNTDMEDFAQVLLASVELQYRQVEIR